ncbi:NAD-dependent isocitrate dehydrogenase [Ascosphaera pollenicola]|nr:NAD-dependent isocitrate dehydrogenase [Ascosphaera pollenicola]
MAVPSERAIREYYHLPSAFPEEWPAELDASDDSSDEEGTQPAVGDNRLQLDRRKSRYFALQGDRRSALPGSDMVDDDNLLPTDEPDPLGTSNSVVSILKRRGLPVDRDSRMRNRFLLSSTTFSPGLFLSQVHSMASTQSLLQGLECLSKSIDQKSASLKVLVESNFERFVRAKATIDNVYNEMRDQGGKDKDLGGSDTASKYALTRDNEYGIKSIRVPLVEASARAEEVWGPALIGRQREDDLKSVITAMERHRAIYEVGGNVRRFIRQRDYDAIVAEYTRARRFATDARLLAERTVEDQATLTDEQVHTIIITGKMWVDVEDQIQVFKRDLWKRLSNIQANSEDYDTEGPVEEYMEIIIALLELGVSDNPVWIWLLGRYDFLKSKITVFCDRSKVEIELMRRQLASGEKPTPHKIAPFMRLQNKDGTRNPTERLDRDPVVQMWEHVHGYLKKLLSLENGMLAEALDFWATIQSFINGERRKMLPAGYDGESNKHHQLQDDQIKDLKTGVIELLNLIRKNTYALFVEPPIDDVSSLLTPTSPGTPLQHLISTESRFRSDMKDLPPNAQRSGQFWEDFAFWPPWATSLSGAHYLTQFMALIGTACVEMAASNLVGRGDFFEKLKILVSATREHCVRAICAAWNKDVEYCKYFEEWVRDPERRNITKMPILFTSFEIAILSALQKIIFVSEAKGKSRGLEVISIPPSKLVQTVRTQFVTSVYKTLSGMVENAEHPIQPEGENEWVVMGPSSTVSRDHIPSMLIHAGGVDSKKRPIRMLLTLSNLRALRSDFVPKLIANFESYFTVKLAEESKTVFDVLLQIDTKLFRSYTRPIVVKLDAEVRRGVTAEEWLPTVSRPTEVRPYVFTVMLQLVMVHTEVSTTLPSPASETSSSGQGSLAYAILSHLLVQISSSLLTAFTTRPRYSISALMQATLDIEFIAQTLSQYSSEEASKVQSQIYLELDRRTDDEARDRLQTELGEMRSVLKKLRENTKGEFACFRKVRSPAK